MSKEFEFHNIRHIDNYERVDDDGKLCSLTVLDVFMSSFCLSPTHTCRS